MTSQPVAVAGAEPANAAIDWLVRRPRRILAGSLVLGLVALAGLLDFRAGEARLRIDPSLDPLVAHDDPERLAYDRVRHRFGLDEAVVVVLHTADAYALDSLRRLDRLTRALHDLPGVVDARSLSSTPLPRVEDGQLAMERIAPEELDDPDLPRRLRERLAANPVQLDQLLGRDGRSAPIAVLLEGRTDAEVRASGVVDAILALAERERAPGVEIWVTGAAVVNAATADAVTRQLRWALPAITLLLAAVLALAFRSVHAVVLPLATIALALAITLAILAMLGRPLNLITSLVPPLLITMGLAYCAHVISEFETLLRRDPAADPASHVRALLQEVAGPVLLTGFTTAVGLLALLLNQLPAVREFAWLSALGVGVTVVLVLSFLPAALCFVRPRASLRRLPGARWFEDGSSALGRFDLRRRGAILLAAAGVFALALLCGSRIQVGDHFVGIFPPESRVRADFEAINRALGGVNPLLIAFESPEGETFTDPRTLRALDELQAWLKQQPEVGAVSGLTDRLRELNRVLGGAGSGALPESGELARQLLFFGDGPALRGIVNSDRSSTLISLRLTVDDTASVNRFIERVTPRLAALPPPVTARITGETALLARSVATVTTGQLQSIGLALLLVFLCLSAQFTSFTVGLKTSLPTVLQTAIYFGALGVSGVPLNSTTALVECLVLGLAVDDTIHYLARFNAAAKRSGSESAAAVSALAAVLRPVTLTKGILALGFLMLVTGELQNQVLFGYLAAFTLAAAWLVDVFVTPAFMSGMRIVTLWDTLRLDLGRDVQSTIPLFAGLSTRQARVFALMSNLQTVPAGTRLITQGAPGGDVYVVIEGELSAWRQREDGTRVELSTLRRGAVLGEAGYFGQKRTANIDALTRVRLLRFDDADRERILRRYPRIAARVFLNLARVQAERTAAQMRRV